MHHAVLFVVLQGTAATSISHGWLHDGAVVVSVPIRQQCSLVMYFDHDFSNRTIRTGQCYSPTPNYPLPRGSFDFLQGVWGPQLQIHPKRSRKATKPVADGSRLPDTIKIIKKSLSKPFHTYQKQHHKCRLRMLGQGVEATKFQVCKVT